MMHTDFFLSISSLLPLPLQSCVWKHHFNFQFNSNARFFHPNLSPIQWISFSVWSLRYLWVKWKTIKHTYKIRNIRGKPRRMLIVPSHSILLSSPFASRASRIYALAVNYWLWKTRFWLLFDSQTLSIYRSSFCLFFHRFCFSFILFNKPNHIGKYCVTIELE